MNNEILNMARNLGLEIQKSKEFSNLKTSKEKMDSDESLVKLRQEFDSIKENLNKEISDNGSDKQTIKDLSDKLRTTYEQINDSNTVSEYESAKKEIDELVNEVINIIKSHAYGKFESLEYGSCSSCSGDCGNCNAI